MVTTVLSIGALGEDSEDVKGGERLIWQEDNGCLRTLGQMGNTPPGVCHMQGTPAGQLLDTGANTSACLAT